MKQKNIYKTKEFEASRNICEELLESTQLKFKTIGGGINGNILTAQKGEKKLIIKIYNGRNKGEKAERLSRERAFREYLKHNLRTNYPNIIRCDDNHAIAIMEYIPGEDIANLTNEDIEQITVDIKRINAKKLKFEKLQEATESLHNIDDFKNRIIQRMKTLKVSNNDTKLSREAKEWFADCIKHKIIEELKHERLDIRMKQWQSPCLGRYASYSDVGTHNMKRVNNKFYYFDFEYSGKDDIAKYVNDWTESPDSKMREEQKIQFERRMIDLFGEQDETCGKRIESVKRIIRYKWVLIMLNSAKINRITEEQVQKIKSYCVKKKLL